MSICKNCVLSREAITLVIDLRTIGMIITKKRRSFVRQETNGINKKDRKKEN
jgi:hypothetical protein